MKERKEDGGVLGYRRLYLILSYILMIIGVLGVAIVLYVFTELGELQIASSVPPTRAEFRRIYNAYIFKDLVALAINLGLLKLLYKVHQFRKQFLVFVVITVVIFGGFATYHKFLWTEAINNYSSAKITGEVLDW